MKKLTALLLSLAMVFALAACGGTTATPSSSAPASSAPVSSAPTEVAAGGNIGICIYKFDDNFMTVYRNQLQKVLEEKGYKVTIADGNNDQAKQTEQINTFISQKVDALIINPVQSTAASSIINLVKEANIPTVLINREPSTEDLDLYDKLSYVGADASQSGSFQGQLILDTANKGDINGDGVVSYIMIQGDPENIDAKLRTEYSVKALVDAGVKVEELDMQRGDWDQEKGQTICANALAKFGDKVEVVFANNDAMALGALQAIKAANRTVGENIYLVGVDALDDAVAQVDAGEMTGTVLNDAVGQAGKAVEVMEMLLDGQQVEKRYIVDYVMVTKDNVSDYLK